MGWFDDVLDSLGRTGLIGPWGSGPETPNPYKDLARLPPPEPEPGWLENLFRQKFLPYRPTRSTPEPRPFQSAPALPAPGATPGVQPPAVQSQTSPVPAAGEWTGQPIYSPFPTYRSGTQGMPDLSRQHTMQVRNGTNTYEALYDNMDLAGPPRDARYRVTGGPLLQQLGGTTGQPANVSPDLLKSMLASNQSGASSQMFLNLPEMQAHLRSGNVSQIPALEGQRLGELELLFKQQGPYAQKEAARMQAEQRQREYEDSKSPEMRLRLMEDALNLELRKKSASTAEIDLEIDRLRRDQSRSRVDPNSSEVPGPEANTPQRRLMQALGPQANDVFQRHLAMGKEKESPKSTTAAFMADLRRAVGTDHFRKNMSLILPYLEQTDPYGKEAVRQFLHGSEAMPGSVPYSRLKRYMGQFDPNMTPLLGTPNEEDMAALDLENHLRMLQQYPYRKR